MSILFHKHQQQTILPIGRVLTIERHILVQVERGFVQENTHLALWVAANFAPRSISFRRTAEPRIVEALSLSRQFEDKWNYRLSGAVAPRLQSKRI